MQLYKGCKKYFPDCILYVLGCLSNMCIFSLQDGSHSILICIWNIHSNETQNTGMDIVLVHTHTHRAKYYVFIPLQWEAGVSAVFRVNSKSEQIDSLHWANCQWPPSLQGSEWMECLVWTTVPRPSPSSQKGWFDGRTDRGTKWTGRWTDRRDGNVVLLMRKTIQSSQPEITDWLK